MDPASIPDTVLIDAIKHQQPLIVDALLAYGADPNTLGCDSRPALWWAAHRADSQHRAMLHSLLAWGAEPKRLYANRDLMLRLVSDVGLLREALAHGMDVNLRDNEVGYTLLMWAVSANRRAAVEVLLQAGASIQAQDWGGHTALEWAAWEGHTALITRLQQAGATPGTDYARFVLMGAIRSHQLGRVRQILQQGVSARSQVGGMPALLWAVESGDVETVRCLLRYGASIYSTDSVGRTAMQLAREKSDGRIMKVLQVHSP
ncbi:MAG: ankyrin repeat domain-containing protein [Armatimonadetes bacterium]|nr:ankyrin repeat domain-containing protein [Armatimonadota bacterium]